QQTTDQAAKRPRAMLSAGMAALAACLFPDEVCPTHQITHEINVARLMLPEPESRSSRCGTMLDRRDFGADSILGDLQFVMRLQVHPIFGCGSPVAGEAKSRVSGDSAFAVYDSADPVHWNVDLFGELIHTQPCVAQIFRENRARMNGRKLSGSRSV